MEKKRILYLSHINWRWIKQRPQYIAEELAKKYEICVRYSVDFRDNQLQKNRDSNIIVKPMYRLPLLSRYRLLRGINIWIGRTIIRKELQRKTDYIYVTAPDQVNFLKGIKGVKVIYDCMDDHVSLAKYNVKSCEPDERKLVKRADYILASSNKIKENLYNRYPEIRGKSISVVRNAYNGKVLMPENVEVHDNRFVLAYFGTVSSWFDFDMIKASLDIFENLFYKIIGPVETELYYHDRIEYVGTVEHDKLYDAVKEANCLIMPFKRGPIVDAVDPVKIYEYINFNKNILMVQYPEVERFSDYVYFYNNLDEYIEQIKLMMGTKQIKYSNSERISFLQENTWQSRADQIISSLESEGSSL